MIRFWKRNNKVCETKTIGSKKGGGCRVINEGIEIHVILQLRLNAVRDGVTSPLFSVTPLLPDYDLVYAGITTGNLLVLDLVMVPLLSLMRIS